MALFISLEGGEGAGKSTQAKRLVQALTELGIPTFLLHEPGSTNLGFHIRDLIKGRPWGSEPMSHGAELFLFAASRAELVSKVLSKQMDTDQLVIIADRYADSTTAYQGYGRKLPLDLVEATNRLATGGLMPHKTFLLDCPPDLGLARVGSVQTHLFDMHSIGRLDKGEGSRRFEEEPLAFHERVRNGYHQLVRAEPDRWVVVDCARDEDSVFESIWDFLQQLSLFRDLVSIENDPMPPALTPITAERL